MVGVLYTILIPTEEEGFTEFYLLGSDGKANNYPTNLTTGSQGNVTIGVVNHEYSNQSYLVKIKQNNATLKEEKVNLENNQKKDVFFEFTAGPPGEYKLEFELYKLPDTQKIYRSVFLLLKVY